jgi:hypothetical protein
MRPAEQAGADRSGLSRAAAARLAIIAVAEPVCVEATAREVFRCLVSLALGRAAAEPDAVRGGLRRTASARPVLAGPTQIDDLGGHALSPSPGSQASGPIIFSGRTI